jgi:hypothetical protein
MKALCPLASPLTATAGVMAGLALIALPMLRLTSAAPEPPPVAIADDAAHANAVLRLHTLVPLREIVIADAAGGTLLRLQDTPAGESEHDVALEIIHGGLDLELAVAGATVETAVFVTLMPDGREELTRHSIGSGDFHDILRYDWPHTH